MLTTDTLPIYDSMEKPVWVDPGVKFTWGTPLEEISGVDIVAGYNDDDVEDEDEDDVEEDEDEEEEDEEDEEHGY